jgi:hypothetical protein
MQDSKLFTGAISANWMYQDGVVKVININYRPNKQVKSKDQINPELYTTLPEYLNRLCNLTISANKKSILRGLYYYDPDFLAFVIQDKFQHHGIWVHKTKSKLLLNTDIINTTLLQSKNQPVNLSSLRFQAKEQSKHYSWKYKNIQGR